jgi:hypothetical protein
LLCSVVIKPAAGYRFANHSQYQARSVTTVIGSRSTSGTGNRYKTADAIATNAEFIADMMLMLAFKEMG